VEKTPVGKETVRDDSLLPSTGFNGLDNLWRCASIDTGSIFPKDFMLTAHEKCLPRPEHREDFPRVPRGVNGELILGPKADELLRLILKGQDPRLTDTDMSQLLDAGYIEVFSGERVSEMRKNAERHLGVARICRFEEELAKQLSEKARQAEDQFSARGFFSKALELISPSKLEGREAAIEEARKEATNAQSGLQKLQRERDFLKGEESTLHELVGTACGYFLRVTAAGKVFCTNPA
jgi:hypothetical protein